MKKATKTERRTRQRTPEQAEARKLVTFLETGELLAGTLQLKEAMSRILATLGRHHGMMRSTVTLLDPDTNELRIVRRMVWTILKRAVSAISWEKVFPGAWHKRVSPW